MVGLAIYVVAYYSLSRSSLNKVSSYGIRGFYYVPCSPEKIFQSKSLCRLHIVGVVFFFPVWIVDHKLLGGPSYAFFPDDGGFSAEPDTVERK